MDLPTCATCPYFQAAAPDPPGPFTPTQPNEALPLKGGGRSIAAGVCRRVGPSPLGGGLERRHSWWEFPTVDGLGCGSHPQALHLRQNPGGRAFLINDEPGFTLVRDEPEPQPDRPKCFACNCFLELAPGAALPEEPTCGGTICRAEYEEAGDDYRMACATLNEDADHDSRARLIAMETWRLSRACSACGVNGRVCSCPAD